MNTTNHGGPAFPVHPDIGTQEPHAGMTLRDYFAAKAMQVLMAERDTEDDDNPSCPTWEPHQVAELAYEQADAMLKAREAVPQEN